MKSLFAILTILATVLCIALLASPASKGQYMVIWKELINRLFLELSEVATVKLPAEKTRPFVEGDEVMVYDRYRFAIPLRGAVSELSQSNDGIAVKLMESNNAQYPTGEVVWVHAAQLRSCV